MLTNAERQVLVRRSNELRAERESIDETIRGYEQEKRSAIAELEIMLHLLARDVLNRNDCPTEDGGDDAE